MLATDIAQKPLAVFDYYSAKPLAVKMGASFSLRQLKMRHVTAVIYALSYLEGICAAERGVFLRRRAVDIYLPANAAAVAATVCYADEILIIFGGKKLHITHSDSILFYIIAHVKKNVYIKKKIHHYSA